MKSYDVIQPFIAANQIHKSDSLPVGQKSTRLDSSEVIKLQYGSGSALALHKGKLYVSCVKDLLFRLTCLTENSSLPENSVLPSWGQNNHQLIKGIEWITQLEFDATAPKILEIRSERSIVIGIIPVEYDNLISTEEILNQQMQNTLILLIITKSKK